MASKMIGIEIGSATLKLTVVQGDQVLSAASARMPEGLVQEGRVTVPAAMTGLLKNMMKENGIRGGRCALVLPPQITVCQHLALPVMSEAELKLNLPFEFRDYVGRDAEEYDYDYIVAGIHDGLMDLYAAAARRSIVEEYWSIFKKAGMTLKLAMPAEMAWLNLIARQKTLPGKLAIVDIGHHNTRVNIFADGNFVMGKDIEYAGQHFDEAIAAETHVDAHTARIQKEANLHQVQSADFLQHAYGALAIEIMKTLNFYNYSSPAGEAQLQDICFCGGGSMIEPLCTAIISATGMTPHHIRQLINMEGMTEAATPLCGLAIGAAVQSV